MAETMENGSLPVQEDVEMKEEAILEPSLENIQQHTDMTDPLPAPGIQTTSNGTAPIPDAPVTTPQQPPPAASTPPVSSSLSARPSSMPPQPPAKPEKPVAHGGPTRLYLNQNVTPHLLEGMKYLAAHEPDKPLAWLANFLQQRSKEVEG